MMRIALAGAAGSGKSTVAGLLTEHHQFVELAFADAIRDMLRATSQGWAAAEYGLGYLEAKRIAPFFRDEMIRLGEAARTHIGPDVWVDALHTRLAKYLRAGDSIVISDIRRDNEVAYLRRHGFTFVTVHRDQVDETDLLKIKGSLHLTNPGYSLAELRLRVDQLLTGPLSWNTETEAAVA